MNVLKMLFDFRGRATRAEFWRAALVWAVAIPGAYLFAGGVMAGMKLAPNYGIVIALVSVVLVPTLVSIAAVGSRRLHDRGRSGLWMLAFMLGPYVAPMVLASVLPMSEDPSDTALALVLVGTTLPFWGWGLIELGLLPGTPGPNRFGEPPLAADVAQPA